MISSASSIFGISVKYPSEKVDWAFRYLLLHLRGKNFFLNFKQRFDDLHHTLDFIGGDELSGS